MANQPSFCQILKRGIDQLEKDVKNDEKSISTQEDLIQQLIANHAKPPIVEKAKERLQMLQSQIEGDEAQLSAFRDEFAADCR
jgi:hypothetical protein